jgi:ABC-type Na+ efflux pump permease subunit
MNKLLVVAANLAAFTTAVHLFVGGADTAVPLLESSMEGEPKYTLYAVWHMVSVVLGLSAVALLVGSLPRHAQGARYLVLFISVMWCVFAVVFLGIAAMQEEGGWLFRLPQWILLLPVGVLGLWAFASTASRAPVEPEEHS